MIHTSCAALGKAKIKPRKAMFPFARSVSNRTTNRVACFHYIHKIGPSKYIDLSISFKYFAMLSNLISLDFKSIFDYDNYDRFMLMFQVDSTEQLLIRQKSYFTSYKARQATVILKRHKMRALLSLCLLL